MNAYSRFLRPILFLAGASCLSGLALAQVEFPAPSPRAQLKQIVGLTEVEVDYSRPGVKEREIYGGLVPYGKVWRTGANASTKLSFSDDVELGGQTVPAGTYALYTIPGTKQWTIILSKKTDLWGAYEYDEADDLLRFSVKAETLPMKVETFTISVGELQDAGGTLFLDWETTRVPIEIKADPHERVMAQIEAEMSKEGPKDPRLLYGAASYYLNHGEDLEQALEWVEEAISRRKRAAFWMIATKAEILAELGRSEEVVKTAEVAHALAFGAGEMGYVKRMERLLEEHR